MFACAHAQEVPSDPCARCPAPCTVQRRHGHKSLRGLGPTGSDKGLPWPGASRDRPLDLSTYRSISATQMLNQNELCLD